jgi:hypothetical protein
MRDALEKKPAIQLQSSNCAADRRTNVDSEVKGLAWLVEWISTHRDGGDRRS